MVEAGFNHANAVSTKQRNILDLEECGDLQLILIILQPNIKALVDAHQTHPSH